MYSNTCTPVKLKKDDCLTDLEWQEWALLQVAAPDEVTDKIMREQVWVIWELSREFCHAKLRGLWTAMRLIETAQTIAAPYIDTFSRSVESLATQQVNEQSTLDKDAQRSRIAVAEANGQNTSKFDATYLAVGIGNFFSQYLHTDTSTHARDGNGFWTHLQGVRTDGTRNYLDRWIFNIVHLNNIVADNRVGEGEGHENFSWTRGTTANPDFFTTNAVANPFAGEYGYIFGDLATIGNYPVFGGFTLGGGCSHSGNSITENLDEFNYSLGIPIIGFSGGESKFCGKKASNNSAQSQGEHYGYGYDLSTETNNSTQNDDTRHLGNDNAHYETHGTIVDPITGVLSTDVWSGASSDVINKRSDSNHSGTTHSDDLDTMHRESQLKEQSSERSQYEVNGQSTAQSTGQSSKADQAKSEQISLLDYQRWSQWAQHLQILWGLFYNEFQQYRRIVAQPIFAATGHIAPQRENYRRPPSFCGVPRVSPSSASTTAYAAPCRPQPRPAKCNC